MVTRGFFPLLKTYIYVFDYVKDCCLFIYLCYRIEFIATKFILLKYMIYAHGASIVTSGVIMGAWVQTNESLMGSINTMSYSVLLRSIIFVVTPLMPVVIILRAVNLMGKKERLVDAWRRNRRMAKMTSVSRSWHSYRRLESERRRIMEAFADLKMVECSTEAVPQLFFLIVFTIASTEYRDETGLGLVKDESDDTYTFLVLSMIQSYVTIVMAIVGAVKIRKSGGLDLIVLNSTSDLSTCYRSFTITRDWMLIADFIN